MQNIQEIQARVDAEREIISALDAEITDCGLQQHLRQAKLWVDDVESTFLRGARQESRTPDQLDRWLSYAEMPLEWATQRRKDVQRILAERGPNAVTVG